MGTPRVMDSAFPSIEIPALHVGSDDDMAIGSAGAYAAEQPVASPHRFVVFEGVDHRIQEREPERSNEEMLVHLAANP